MSPEEHQSKLILTAKKKPPSRDGLCHARSGLTIINYIKNLCAEILAGIVETAGKLLAE